MTFIIGTKEEKNIKITLRFSENKQNEHNNPLEMKKKHNNIGRCYTLNITAIFKLQTVKLYVNMRRPNTIPCIKIRRFL